MRVSSLSNKVLTWVLSISLISFAGPGVAFADDQVTDRAESESIGTSVAQSVEDSLEATQKTDDVEAASISDQNESGELALRSDLQVVESDSAFEFVYVDSKAVELSETQSVVVSFVDKGNADSATLWYQKIGGSLESVHPKQVEDGAALFELAFTSDDQVGPYCLVKVSWEGAVGGEAPIPGGSEMGYCFSVVHPSNDVQAESVSVYAIDEEGELTETDSVEDAIDESAMVDVDASRLGRFAASSTQSGDMVIALDPGHGGSDPGALSDDGLLVEAEINYKIASYCKSVLDQYSGVTTIMTRSADEYVGLTERVDRAVAADADVFISFHVNSAEVKATGFEVWIQNDSSWRDYLHEESSELASAILDKLAKFGLADRGNKERDSQNGNTYDDGSPADYLTVLYKSRLNDIPAVLIEHGFINGSAADRALLSSENSLRELGEADAEAIIEYYGLSKGIPDMFDPSGSSDKVVENGVYVINSSLSNTKVLDVPAASKEPGTAVQLYDSNNSDAQKFEIEWNSSSGYYTLRNLGSQLVLGLEKNKDGTYKTRVVQQSEDPANNAQNWILSKNADSSFTIKNAINPNYSVDVASASTENGAVIQLYASNGSAAQKFNLLSVVDVVGARTVDDALYVIRNSGSGKVLDIAGASEAAGANCQQYDSNGTAAQKFVVEYDGAGFYTLVNLRSGKALEVQDAFPVMSTNVQQGDGSIGDAQKWAISENGDGTFKLVSKATGLAMDVSGGSKESGANIGAYSDNGTAAQRFSFESAKGEKAVEEGVYAITAQVGANMVLDVPGASKDDSVALQLYRANGSAAQAFEFSFDEKTGFYAITNVNSGKALDLVGAGTANGTRVQQYQPNGTLAQRWVVEDAGDGSFQIRSALDTGKCVDVVGGSSASGAAIDVYDSNGTAAQRFAIVDPSEFCLIMGVSGVTAQQLASHYSQKVGAAYPGEIYSDKGAPTISEFCNLLTEEAAIEGVRSDVLYAQIMLETNYLRFGGDVQSDQCNFSGLGATGNGNPGLSFQDVRTGIRASVQHLKAYASTDDLVNECVDPRFGYVDRGCAPSVYDLSGKWASDPQYGNKIVSIMNEL